MSTNKKRRVKITLFWVVISFAASNLCFHVLPGVFAPWNAQTIDRLFMIRATSDRLRPAYDKTIVHVDINNSAIQQLNDFYLNRTHFAKVINNLAEMQTAIQVYDLIFAARSNEKDDNALIASAKQAGNVYFGLALALTLQETARQKQPRSEEALRYLDATSWRVNVQGDTSSFFAGSSPLPTFPALASASRGLGFLSMKPDGDGVFRRVPLLVRYGDAFYPSLPFRVVCDYLGVPSERIFVTPGGHITLKGAKWPAGPVHDIEIPIDRYGNMVVNFIGPWERMKHYNFAEIYRALEDKEDSEVWRREFQGKIVLVSDVSTGSTDIGPVPTDISFPLSGLHANVLHTILTEEFFRELSGREMIVIEILLAAAIFLLSIRFSPLFFSLGTVSLAAVYLGIVALAFFQVHLILHVVRPLFLLIFGTLFLTAYRYFEEEKDKEVLRKTFEAYFPPSVVKKIMSNPSILYSKGQKKELTVLFSDIKSFTAYCAALPPDQVQRYLNEYFEAMVEIVFSHQGTVDKYIGDGLMVFFGDPEPQPDHALRCVRAAVDMQKKARELKERWEKEGGIPIRVRIGINTGEMLVGNMGSARRLSYTVLGSAVNLAQRLESSAPVESILIAQRTYDLVKEHVPARSLGRMQFKGIERPVDVYEVLVDGQSGA